MAVTELKPEMSDAEWQTRVDLAALYRLIHHYGWSDLFGTHISARIPDAPDTFLLNPYGYLFEEITASMLVKVDEDGNAFNDSEHGINPAGFTIHSAVHMAKPDINWVIHTHTAAGTGVATQKDGIRPLTQHAMVVIAHTGYHDYEGIATDLGERERLARDLGDNRVLVLRNHGLLTVGASPGEAFLWMYRAERACRMQLACQQAGAEMIEIPEDVQRTTIERNKFNNSDKGFRTIGKAEWPGLLRQLDRIDPSYKT
ncbi:MAG: class II aldolase/adducin family protein [Magnetovibrio sp.]|nr:class II aldolase/adducin family protein [Magnetovibrio sp.]